MRSSKGQAGGLSLEQASRLAIQTAKGAGIYMASGASTPKVLQSNVTSPNGTTFAATETFAQGGIDDLVLKAVQAAAARSLAMSKGE